MLPVSHRQICFNQSKWTGIFCICCWKSVLLKKMIGILVWYQRWSILKQSVPSGGSTRQRVTIASHYDIICEHCFNTILSLIPVSAHFVRRLTEMIQPRDKGESDFLLLCNFHLHLHLLFSKLFSCVPSLPTLIWPRLTTIVLFPRHHPASIFTPQPTHSPPSVFTALLFSSSTLISSLLHVLLRRKIQLVIFCSILSFYLPALLPFFPYNFCSVLATVSGAPVLNSLSTVLRSGSIAPPIHHLCAVSRIPPLFSRPLHVLLVQNIVLKCRSDFKRQTVDALMVKRVYLD